MERLSIPRTIAEAKSEKTGKSIAAFRCTQMILRGMSEKSKG